MPYLAVIGKDEHNVFGGFVLDLHVSAAGANFEEVKRDLEQGIALYLYEIALLGQDVPTARTCQEDVPAEDLDGFVDAAFVQLEATPINPLSVLVDRAIREAREREPSLTDTELARRMNTSRASLARLRDFFYWDHSAGALRKLESALGIHFTYGYQKAG